ncbi:MAG: glycoside hydrolase 43 family protein, partial [Thermoguttaceae bacterium]
MNVKTIGSVAVCVLLCGALSASETGSWGDQGDGTYRNPILNADYPDVDVEQLGDTYYMISSKQHMCPGMVILQSKDMVNWQTIGHVWDKLSWAPEYNWDRMDGYPFGVWAGDLAYHDGTWYCYQIDAKHGLFMSSAKDIRGPWTEPHPMLPTSKVLDDPAVFWDDDNRQAYLLCNTGRKLAADNGKGQGNQNHLFKMSWDGREILDEGTLVYTGVGAEAAKIYRIDGTWYLFLAEWYRPDPRLPDDPEADKGDRKQIVLRSKTGSIYGPYDKKVVFERGNGVIRSCSQGALMQAPDGSWWYTHQLIQNIPAPFQGRPQCLEPVAWIDGWPLIGQDVDGDGIGEPVLHYRKPIQGYPITAPPTSDEFELPKLGVQWEWNHNPRDTHWSLSEQPGRLRLRASVPVGSG